MAKFILAVFLFVLAAVAHKGVALKCYECNSRLNRMCDDPWNENATVKMVECNPIRVFSNSSLRFDVLPPQLAAMFQNISTPRAQLKSGTNIPHTMVCIKAKILTGEKRMIMRHCMETHAFTDPAQRGSRICERIQDAMGNKVTHCSICRQDGCNSATGVAAMALLVAPLLVLSRKLS